MFIVIIFVEIRGVVNKGRNWYL